MENLPKPVSGQIANGVFSLLASALVILTGSAVAVVVLRIEEEPSELWLRARAA